MTGKKAKPSVQDLVGQRIVHAQANLGTGSIVKAYYGIGGPRIEVIFDNDAGKLRVLLLNDCMDKGLIRFEACEDYVERRRIYNYLVRERQVKHLVHFTPESNLKSILSSGIMPRSELNEKQIHAEMPDEYRLDNCEDYSSFSISFPNYRVFYSKRNNTGYKYAVLLIDPRIIMDLPLDAISYLPDNAASARIGGVEKLVGIKAVQNLFLEKISYRNRIYSRDEYSLQKEFTTNPQAEAFIRATVNQEYIQSIIVQDEEQAKRIGGELQSLKARVPAIVQDCSYYKQRGDWRFWSEQSYM